MAGPSGRRNRGGSDKEDDSGRDILRFPARRGAETVGRKEALDEAEKAGFPIKTEVQRMLRLPSRLVRGIIGKLEFYDELSVQPFPHRNEDSPSFCFDNGLPAPAWIERRYLAFEEKEGRKFITFVDASRGVFVKGELAEQEQLAAKIYDRLIGAAEGAGR
ncbi:MAG: hypothetical protein AB1529_07495 [Candidatus Micrarchaeota archaeon]